MKFKFITLTAFASFGLFLGSFSSGPTGSQGDLTGSPLSSATCNRCHAQTASLSPSVVIGVQETATQTPVSNGEYTPGTVYTVSFASASTGAKFTTSGGVQYLEHSQRSSTGVFTMQWTAPAAGTGNVTLYVSGMAVNGGGSSGDALAQATLALTENVSTSITKVANQLDYQVYPNPVTNNQITVEGIDGEAMVVLTDLAGRQVWSQQLTSNQMEIPTLPKGIYQLTAIQGKKIGTQQLIIQ